MGDEVQVQPGAPVVQVIGAPADGVTGGVDPGVSTLQPSQQQQENDAANASIPILPLPNFDLIQFVNNVSASPAINIAEFKFEVNEKLNQICLDMLKKWGDSIKEEAARRKKELMDPNEIRKTEEKLNFVQVLDSYGQSANVRQDAFIPVMTVGLLFASNSVATGAVFNLPANEPIGVLPSQNQNASANFFAAYPSDMRAELGLLGAAMLQGAMYLAVAQSLGAEGAKNGKGTEQVSAENYAESVINLVSSGTLTSMVTALVTQNYDSSTQVDPKKLEDVVQSAVKSLKIVLLMTALAALYAQGKGGTERITGDELEGLINGTNETFGPNSEQMSKLIGMINEEVGDSKDYASLMNAIYNFVDNPNNNSLAALTNPAKVMGNLMPYFSRSPVYEKG